MTSKQVNKMKAGRWQEHSVISFSYKMISMQVQIHKGFFVCLFIFLKHFLISNSSVKKHDFRDYWKGSQR